jgi:membrane peptidoglycan carboxypeptidase
MQETLASGTARKADLGGYPAAGKTGTSQDFRDAWFVGYTGHLVTGVWLGNDDNSATKKLTGGAMPVDIWSRFMKAAHQGLPMAELPGMAGRTIEPQAPQAPAPPVAPAHPITSMLSPPQAATPLSREDDARPLVPTVPARPPVAVAPQPPRAIAPRPQQTATPVPRPPAASPPRVTAAPLPRMAAVPQPQYVPPPQSQPAPPLQLSNVPRPPGAVGTQEVRAQPAPAGGNGVSNFFDNIFGRR